MKKIGPIILALLAAALFWFFTQNQSIDPSTRTIGKNDLPLPISPPADVEQAGSKKGQPNSEAKYDDLSAQFMIDYGKEESPPLDDIRQVAQMLESYFLLVKTVAPLPLGENRETTAALTGQNPYRTRLLSPDSPWLNENQEFIDRWGTPLYFHAIGSKQVGIRSAGPDQKMWTSDDLIDGPNAEPEK